VERYVGVAVSIESPRESAAHGLNAVLRQAGAVFAARDGQANPVAVSYGSAAGELAACVSAAGMADSSALTKLELSGPRARLGQFLNRETGHGVAEGGVVQGAGAWWCGVGRADRAATTAMEVPGAGGPAVGVAGDPAVPGASDPAADAAGDPAVARFGAERVIVLAEPRLGARLSAHLSARVAREPGLRLEDRTDEWSAITILGRATPGVLSSLGVFGQCLDLHRVSPFTTGRLAGAWAMWLLQSEHLALALVPRVHADSAWRAIERAGRAQHICCVGQDAVTRYALLERRSGHTART
jgi:glycine cleavage system aminomethyltransferase T